MTTAEFGFCPAHGVVPTKYDFSTGVLIVGAILTFLIGIGLFFLMFYVLYVLAIKDRTCSICGGMVYPAPMPMPYPQAYPPSGYYMYPPRMPYYPPPR